jgi:hypothetical protein
MQNRKNRDYVKLKFSLNEPKITFKKGKNGNYNADIVYDAQDKVLISVFSHVKDSAEVIHNITQEMATIEKGWEGHFVCKEGKDVSHQVQDIRLDANDSTIFDKKITNGVYPFVIRMVSYSPNF